MIPHVNALITCIEMQTTQPYGGSTRGSYGTTPGVRATACSSTSSLASTSALRVSVMLATGLLRRFKVCRSLRNRRIPGQRKQASQYSIYGRQSALYMEDRKEFRLPVRGGVKHLIPPPKIARHILAGRSQPERMIYGTPPPSCQKGR